ncbi:MAG: D-hexose-6-phosphate mutarotase [Methylococcales bacterium]|nr:D-hexose-6-phosphate mutarotase [Methylococcales bacterium]
MDIDDLNLSYGIAGQLSFVKGKGGFPFILVNNHSASALISVYAAQVLSYRPRGESEDLLFLSPKAVYGQGKAIRGGIPVCWPWFGPNPCDLDAPKHGFVRNGLWTVASTSTINADETKIKLKFAETVQSERCWQHDFDLELDISIGNTLTLELVTRNTGDQSFSITQAFHTYFQVGDINHVQVLGLENTGYMDKLDEDALKLQQGAVTVAHEVDRIYSDVNTELIINDAAFDRQIRLTSTNNKSAVVWNPWQDTSVKMPDLEADDYRRFICVEAGNMGADVIDIPPASEYRLHTQFKIIRD